MKNQILWKEHHNTKRLFVCSDVDLLLFLWNVWIQHCVRVDICWYKEVSQSTSKKSWFDCDLNWMTWKDHLKYPPWKPTWLYKWKTPPCWFSTCISYGKMVGFLKCHVSFQGCDRILFEKFQFAFGRNSKLPGLLGPLGILGRKKMQKVLVVAGREPHQRN